MQQAALTAPATTVGADRAQRQLSPPFSRLCVPRRAANRRRTAHRRPSCATCARTVRPKKRAGMSTEAQQYGAHSWGVPVSACRCARARVCCAGAEPGDALLQPVSWTRSKRVPFVSCLQQVQRRSITISCRRFILALSEIAHTTLFESCAAGALQCRKRSWLNGTAGYKLYRQHSECLSRQPPPPTCAMSRPTHPTSTAANQDGMHTHRPSCLPG